MTFKEEYEKVNASDKFKEFIKENPEAELCGAFFIIDYISNDNKKSIDYKVNDKIFSFNIKDSGEVKLDEDKLVEVEGKKFPELKKINPDVKVDVDELRGLAGMKALDEGIAAKFNKIIAVLQNYDNKQIWNLTCMLDGLIILNVLIDSETSEITKFERKSFMDLIKKK